MLVMAGFWFGLFAERVPVGGKGPTPWWVCLILSMLSFFMVWCIN